MELAALVVLAAYLPEAVSVELGQKATFGPGYFSGTHVSAASAKSVIAEFEEVVWPDAHYPERTNRCFSHKDRFLGDNCRETELEEEIANQNKQNRQSQSRSRIWSSATAT